MGTMQSSMRSRSSPIRQIEPIKLEANASPIPGYRLTSMRGMGSFGVVWQAEGPDNTRIALKFVSSKSGTQIAREVRNLQLLQLFDHPHLLRVRNIWCHSGYIIIGMDLADGSLLDLLQLSLKEFGAPLGAKMTCFWLAQAADAIDYLNGVGTKRPPGGKGFQHCDLKPSNMLLMGDSLRVADFGISKSMSPGESIRPTGGTLPYCGPEIFEGRIGLHTDQFALAVSYFLLRTGQFPFADSPHDYIPCRTEPDLSLLSVVEQNIVKRALDPIPERRWLTCREFVSNLQKATVNM